MSRLKMIDTEENLSCNLIPMIDIMFLLLLFFMLSADMSILELEDVVLPQNMEQATKDDDKVKQNYDSHFFAIVHKNIDNTLPDIDAKNWNVKHHGDTLNIADNWDGVKAKIKALADLPGDKEVDASGRQTTFNKSSMVLRCDRFAPYGTVQRLIQAMAEAGFYKIEPGAGLPPPSRPGAAK